MEMFLLNQIFLVLKGAVWLWQVSSWLYRLMCRLQWYWSLGTWRFLRIVVYCHWLLWVYWCIYIMGILVYIYNIGDWFHTTVGVREGCLLSPCLFDIFLEQIMTEALKSFEGNVRIGERSINNLRFADDLDLIAGIMKELAELTERLDKSASAFGMDISAEKSKTMVTPATNETNTNISITVNLWKRYFCKRGRRGFHFELRASDCAK